MIFNLIYRLFRPQHWIKLSPFDKKWDSQLNKMLDEGVVFERLGSYRVVEPQSGTEIWIGSYPYSFGNKLDRLIVASGLPSAKTQDRLYKYLNRV